jgi:hypothetical protein
LWFVAVISNRRFLAAFLKGCFYRAPVSDILSQPSPFDHFNPNGFDPTFFHAQLAFLFKTYH